MRVIVAFEERFYQTQDSNIYSNTAFEYSFWRRYLQVFDEVEVFVRMAETPKKKIDKPFANGPHVHFNAVPMYIGPWQYLKKRHKIKALAKKVVTQDDAFILRIPGRISTLLWHELMKQKKPYGVEVIGSSLDSAKTMGANFLLRSILEWVEPVIQRKQCHHAVAAAYVTQNYLQNYYPPGNWSTHYSSIDLPDNAIIDTTKLKKRLVSLKDAVEGRRPFRICQVGSMATRYKGQDILIKAISICRRKNLDIELTFVGDGKNRNRYFKLADNIGLIHKIHFMGKLPAGDLIFEQLDEADMFVFPSLTEGLPRALIEAMTRGLPCIASNVGGIPELLDAEDLVEPANPPALAYKIEQIVRNKPRLELMAKRNLEIAKKYLTEEVNHRRVEFYKKVKDRTNSWYANRNKAKS